MVQLSPGQLGCDWTSMYHGLPATTVSFHATKVQTEIWYMPEPSPRMESGHSHGVNTDPRGWKVSWILTEEAVSGL